MRVRLYRLDEDRPTEYQLVRDLQLPGFTADEITAWLDRRVEPGLGIGRPDGARVGDIALMHGAHYRRISPREWERVERGELTAALSRQRLRPPTATPAAQGTAPHRQALVRRIRWLRWKGPLGRVAQFAAGSTLVTLVGVTTVGATAISETVAVATGLACAGALRREGWLRSVMERGNLGMRSFLRSGSEPEVTRRTSPEPSTPSTTPAPPASEVTSSAAAPGRGSPPAERTLRGSRPAVRKPPAISSAQGGARSASRAAPTRADAQTGAGQVAAVALDGSTTARLIDSLWRGCTTAESQRSPLSAALGEAIDTVAGEIRSGARPAPPAGFWEELAVRRRAHTDMLVRQLERGERTLLPKEQGVLDVNAEHFDRAFGLSPLLTPMEVMRAAQAGERRAAQGIDDGLTPPTAGPPKAAARSRTVASTQPPPEPGSEVVADGPHLGERSSEGPGDGSPATVEHAGPEPEPPPEVRAPF
jgi:hypothetical protein